MMVANTEGRIREGLPHPLGATWDGEGVNFALFSAHAEKVELAGSIMGKEINQAGETATAMRLSQGDPR